MSESWLDGLNPQQQEAATYGEGPLLIIAGAGTGKTRTLACRVAHLIASGVEPGRTLLLTFTRRAAAEMITRADHMTGMKTASRIWGGTFHAVANRLLRMYGRAVGLPPDFTVLDQSDAADLMNLIRNELGLAKEKRRFARKQTLVNIYSRVVNSQDKLSYVLQRYYPWCKDDIEGIRQIFDGYTTRKRANNVLDYDDLLLFWKLLCGVPEVEEQLAGRFEHILVDEYQDTNAVQADILLGMRRRNRNICVVGDDAQSIYSFRAATVRNILDFPKQFENAHVVTLEQNYRSITPILAASNAVMAYASQRYTKDLWSQRASEDKPLIVTCVDEDDQTRQVCENVIGHLEQGTALMRQAVLFRAGHHSDLLEAELLRRNIPYHKYGGLKFIEAAHIKDMLAFLRILENPYDEVSWYRVLLMLDGIGPRSARRVMNDLGVQRATASETAVDQEADADEPATPLRKLFDDPPKIAPSGRQRFDELRQALQDCQAVNAPADDGTEDRIDTTRPVIASQVERLRRFYEPVFKDKYDNWTIRLRDIEQLEQVAMRYRSRRQFITDLTLDPPTSTSDLAGPPFLEEDWLVLSTIHSAKGCEWDVVHIIHAADGMMPSDMSTGDVEEIEEERRLFYVAMTRAKDKLYIYFPLRYYHRSRGRSDHHSYAQLTRFLPPETHHFFNLVAADASVDDEDQPVAVKRHVHNLDADLRRLFGD